jgi:hypothetical protein
VVVRKWPYIMTVLILAKVNTPVQNAKQNWGGPQTIKILITASRVVDINLAKE